MQPKQRYLANVMLGVSACLFLFAFYLKKTYPDVLLGKMLLAISEAALVGGIADWFAVTALFRKPLGFPYHTALIPRNRERLIQATAVMVESELLSKESIKQKIAQIRLTRLLIQWVDTKQGKTFFIKLLLRYTEGATEQVDTKSLSEKLERWLKTSLQSFNFSPWLKSLGQYLIREKKDEVLLDKLLDQLHAWIEKPESRKALQNYLEQYIQPKGDSVGGFLKMLVMNAAQDMNAVNLADATVALQQEVKLSVEDLKSPNHPMRLWLLTQVREMIARMDQPGPWSDTLEGWKMAFIDRLDLAEFIEKMLQNLSETILQSGETSQELLARVQQDGSVKFTVEEFIQFRKKAPVLAFVLGQFERFWEIFKTDTARQDYVETYLQQLIVHLLEREHTLIGQVAGEALAKLSDHDLVALVDEKAGDDLQWVRVNGSLVGGAVGFILFCYLHFVHFPYLLPWVLTKF